MTTRRTLAIAAAALLCGVGDVLLVLGSEHFPDPGVWAVFGPVVGWSFVGTGLYAWRRRPESRFGLLMVLVGFAWFLGPLYAANSPLVFTLGIVASGLWGPVFGQLLLSFPTGRLPTRARRRVVAASYVLIPLAPVPALLVSDADQVIGDCRGGCPRERAADRAGRGPHRCRARPGVGAVARSLPRGGRHAGPPVARGGGAGAPEPAAGVRQRRGEPRARRRLRDQSGRRPAVDGVRGLRRHAVRIPRGPGAGGSLRLARRAHADGAARGCARARGPARRPGTRARRPRARARVLDAGARRLRRRGRVARRAARRGRPAPHRDRDRPPRKSRRGHRARPRAGRRHRPRRRGGHRPDAGEPAPRCRAARAPGRAARVARATGRGGRRRAPAHRARPPRRRPVAARRARAEPAPRPHEA